jgi:hypothetical protein
VRPRERHRERKGRADAPCASMRPFDPQRNVSCQVPLARRSQPLPEIAKPGEKSMDKALPLPCHAPRGDAQDRIGCDTAVPLLRCRNHILPPHVGSVTASRHLIAWRGRTRTPTVVVTPGERLPRERSHERSLAPSCIPHAEPRRPFNQGTAGRSRRCASRSCRRRHLGQRHPVGVWILAEPHPPQDSPQSEENGHARP